MPGVYESNTRRYLDQLIDYAIDTHNDIFKTDEIGGYSLGPLLIWKKYLEENERPTREANIEGTNIRPIRPSIFIPLQRNGKLWLPIVYEIHKDGTRSKGKTHGGELKLSRERFCSVEDGLRELKHELLYEMSTTAQKIMPRGVIKSSDGRVLQFYHAKLEREPTTEDLKNNTTKWENFEGKWWNYHQLTQEIYLGNIDIHPETMEMILAEHFWGRTQHLATLSLERDTRQRLLERAGVDYPPEVFENAEAYYQTTRKGFLQSIKVLIKAGIFLTELQFDESYFGTELRNKNMFKMFARRFAETAITDNYEMLIEDRLLDDYLSEQTDAA